MQKNRLDEMTGGWFVGDFSPTCFKSKEFEVAVKHYKQGDYEKTHYHQVAVELTVIVSGRVLMNNVEYTQNDIITINPGESTNFLCLENTITVVVKTPSLLNDKYINE